ncbi:chemotaxis protein [Bernardetia sp. MNP-M8]|uniref:chemotaxis protein n=1 Tax=Bernardetia sp. MNP-M8 TaxID=3127470 RepID=UPI0030D23C22
MKNTVKKIMWITGILFIFLLVLATNLIDRDHIKGIRASVSTMYKDRLIVKNLIYNISNLTQEKRIAFLLSDSNFYSTKNAAINDSIYTLIDKFSKTQLTSNETHYLERLYNNFKDVEVLENQSLNNRDILQDKEWRNTMETKLLRLRNNLNSLSDIQINEGKRELARVNRAFNTIDLFTNIEIAFLVIIGIITLLIVLYPTKQEKQ